MSQSFPSFNLNPINDDLFCFPSLLPPQPQIIQLLKCDFQCSRGTETFETMTVTLSQKLLVITDRNKKEEKLDLCFQLTFETIYSDKNNIRSPYNGFRLKNPEINFQMTLTSTNKENLVKWVDQLTKKINRIGFKDYFKPIQRLGRGGYGTVYEVQSLINKKRFAAKAYPKNYFKQNNKALKSLINEIRIMRIIDHPNTIKLYGVYESENTIYILLQLLKGGSLLQRILKTKKNQLQRDSNFAMNESKIKQIIQGTLKGLGYLNSLGIVHRDIKPQNIMLRNMSEFHPVIIDFGFSAIMPNLKNNYINDFQIVYPSCGTPGFLGPELFSTNPTLYISHKSDIFALGATLYMLCAKSSLFSGKNYTEVLMKNKNMEHTIDKNINDEIRDLIERMITRNPNERIDSEQALMHSFLQEKSNYQSYLQNARNNGLKILLEATSEKYEDKGNYEAQN